VIDGRNSAGELSGKGSDLARSGSTKQEIIANATILTVSLRIEWVPFAKSRELAFSA
jgi:hypothetical protein